MSSPYLRLPPQQDNETTVPPHGQGRMTNMPWLSQACVGERSVWTHAVTIWQIMRLFIQREGREACHNNLRVTADWKYLNFKATLSLKWELKWLTQKNPDVCCGDRRGCQWLIDQPNMTWKVHYKNIQSKTINDNDTINMTLKIIKKYIKK